MGYSTRHLCQICGEYFFAIAQHVRTVHKTTITDLEAEGKWKNERNPID